MKSDSKHYQKRPALVLGLSVNGLSVVRSLGRKGIRVFAMGRSRQSEYECSRYIEKFELLPPDIKEDELLERLLEFGQSKECLVFLIPTNDFYVLFVAKHSATLSRYFTFTMASYEVMETVVNKQKLYATAEQLGILCPKTYSPRSEKELIGILDEVAFPCFLKPAYGHVWRKRYKNVKLLKIENKDELLMRFRDVLALGLEVMVQEIVPGGDETIQSLVAFMDKDSNVLAAVTKQKLRQYPVGAGDGCFQITTRNADLKVLGVQLLKGLRYVGPATVEFRWDASRQKFILMEINARTIAAQELIASAGLNFPYLSYRVSNGEAVEPEADGRPGVKWICFEWDFSSFLEGRRMKILSTAAWLRSLRGTNSFAYFCWDDPLPFIVRTFKFIKRCVTASIGKIARSGFVSPNVIARTGGEAARTKQSQTRVSVLIITRNRESVIEGALKKLYGQIDFTRHEVIVVDSSEANETEKLMKNYDWIRYYHIHLPLGTRPQSYSYGAQVSRGEIVAFLDDDARVHPGWLEALERCYDDPLVGAAGGRVLSTEPRSSVTEYNPSVQIGRVLPSGSILSNLHLDSGMRLEVDTVRGCNMSARKDLLEKIGYFDPRIKSPNMRVEDDVCIGIKRLGYKIIYEPKATVLHLAAKRPDALRTVNLKNEFNSSHNTAWFYLKHFRFHPMLLFNVTFLEPINKGIRRMVGGSFRRPQFSFRNLGYLLPTAAGLLGAWWGVVASLSYGLQDRLRPSGSQQKNIPKLSLESLKPNKVVQTVRPKLNILVLDGGLPKTDYSGKIVLVENTLCELNKHYNVRYVYFPEQSEKPPSHSFLNAYTKSIDVLPFAYKESGWGRFLNWLFFKPWFYARWRYPGDWEKARKTLRDLSKKYNIDAVASLTYQTAQFALGLGLPVLNCHGDSKARIVNRKRQKKSSFRDKVNLWLLEKKTYGYESWIIRQSGASIFLSEGDAALYRNTKNEKKIFVIPNGVDTRHFKPGDNGLSDIPTILFTGHMSYEPNADTALRLCRNILPLVQKKIPNAQAVIAGADPNPTVKKLHDGQTVIVTGRVEDLRPYFEQSWVYACPMIMGAGIKNKLLEAMAMKKAVVTTEIAVDGIAAAHGKEFMIADSDQDFADKISELILSESTRNRLGEQARDFVKRDYQWEVLGQKRAQILDRLIQGTKPIAVVLGLSVNSLSVARSLGRRGIFVVAMDRVKNLSITGSRYVRESYVFEKNAREEDLVEELVRFGQKQKQPVFLFPTNDFYVLLVSRYRKVLSKYYAFTMADEDVLETVVNKQLLYEAAKQAGIPCPQTIAVRSRKELDSKINEIRYPCFIKPVYSHIWRAKYRNVKVLEVANRQDILKYMQEILDLDIEVLIQEIIPGGDDAIYSVVAYMDRQHQPIVICSKRKLRQYPIFTGNGCLQISTSQPDLEKLGLKLLQALRYVGPACAVEFKWDARNEQYVLIEINARTEVGQELMTRAGVDIPYIAYMYTMYGKRLDSYTYRTGLKWICFEWDFFSCIEAREKKLYSWTDWVRSLYGVRVFAYFSKDDPFPFFVQTWKFLGTVLRRGFRKILGRGGFISRCEVDRRGAIYGARLIGRDESRPYSAGVRNDVRTYETGSSSGSIKR